MYILIVSLHSVFILLSHLLGYRILEGIFIILWLFFLFYFSPLFFMDEDRRKKEIPLSFSLSKIWSEFSPKESLLIPTVLLYIAVYGFVFSIFGAYYSVFLLHATIIITVFLIFLVYMIAFHWKYEIFFEIFRFHILFTSVSTIIFTISYFLQDLSPSFLHSILGFIGILSGTFLLSYTKKENIIFLSSYLLGIYATCLISLLWIFLGNSFLPFVSFGVFLSFIIFEVLPRYRLFSPYISFFQYFSLSAILLAIPFLSYIVFRNVEATAVMSLLGITVFFLSIHTRYTNYIVFMISIGILYFLYAIIFSGLMENPSISSLFLFIFFLPTLIIGTTYFWQEKHQYDFIILHYASIFFSIMACLYTLLFIPGWWDTLFIISLCVFGLALLFFLSYFRFRIEKNTIH